METKEAKWIWIPDWETKGKDEPAVVYFRKTLYLDQVPGSLRVFISADTRYKLYLNGWLCEVGPMKGDRKVWYYDEVEAAPFLKEGENVWAVEILRYPLEDERSNRSLFRTPMPGFFLESRDLEGKSLIHTDKTWKTKKLSGYRIVSENPYFAPLQIYEERSGDRDTFGWMTEGYPEKNWENAAEYEPGSIPGQLSPERLMKRTIPFPNKIPARFRGISRMECSAFSKKEWEDFLRGEGRIRIPAHSRESVDLDAGELTTGFLRLCVSGGRGAKIRIHQAECYVQSIPERNSYDDLPEKGDRTDASKGLLCGNTDVYQVCGLGSDEEKEKYEPFWFRTFRFVRLTIVTESEPLNLEDFDFLETGYPLESKTKVAVSDQEFSNIWDICERTLRRCMHETYEDCPFYEQLQYCMDSRSQILYTYSISADDRLARQCMDGFGRSQRKDGLLSAAYPDTGNNVIPGFSIFYIGMLYDHMMYFGDREFLQKHLSTVDRILDYFHKNRDERGLVKKIGDRNLPDRYWSFIDWTPQWKETNGVPTATLKGPITMESLLYTLGLEYAVSLNRYLNREEKADQYRDRAGQMIRAVNEHCRGEKGMYTDGPGSRQYSQHCQVFAVLTGAAEIEEGRSYLLETLEHRKRYAQCSVAMRYYLFRAMEKCGIYDRTDELWEDWREMLKNHMTTCAEDPLMSRSDCHAWGALALYELPSVILGVRPAEPGYQKIRISPHAGKLLWAEGSVATPNGMVRVSWQRKESGLEIQAEAPKGTELLILEKAEKK